MAPKFGTKLNLHYMSKFDKLTLMVLKNFSFRFSCKMLKPYCGPTPSCHGLNKFKSPTHENACISILTQCIPMVPERWLWNIFIPIINTFKPFCGTTQGHSLDGLLGYEFDRLYPCEKNFQDSSPLFPCKTYCGHHLALGIKDGTNPNLYYTV